MPTYQKPPTVNDDERAQDIYRKAARIISEKGFDATSMGDIADTVDLTKGGLYYYIKGKKALLYAIMNFALNLLEERVIAAARAQPDPVEQLAILLGGYARLVVGEPEAMRILASEEERLDSTYRPRIAERKRAYSEALRDAIVEVYGESPPDFDPDVAALSILGMVHGVVDWYAADGRLGEDEVVAQVQEIALRGLIAPAPQKGAPGGSARGHRAA